MSSANRRAGFTLIELLVAVVLTGILATILFQMIRGQTAFTQMQSAREEVDQNTRGALELISSELRAVPSAGIVSAGADRITFRLPRVWGVLCAPAEPGSAIAIFPPGVMPAEFDALDASTNASWGIAIQRLGTENEYQTYTINGKFENNATCNDNLSQPFVGVATPPEGQGVTYGAALPPVSGIGGRVFLYETVTYDVAASSDAAIPGVWLRRSYGARTPQQQPLAGPLDTRDPDVKPLAFRYLCNGTELSPAALATPVGRLAVTSVEVQIGMISRESTRSVQQMERDTQLIHLRNSGNATTCP